MSEALLKAASDRDGGGGRGLGASGGLLSIPKTKLGLWVFMVVATTLFSLLASAYYMRMQYPDWRPMPDPWQLWLNTVVLILSCVALQWATVYARRGQVDKLRLSFRVGGLLAFTFLAGQLWAWQHLKDLNYLLIANPANSFFYLMTGLHGLHLAGGLIAWVRTAAKVRRGADARLSVELCATYWHFLLAVWILMFALLLFADVGPRNWTPLIC